MSTDKNICLRNFSASRCAIDNATSDPDVRNNGDAGPNILLPGGGGIAHAQSLHSDPEPGAFWTVSGDSSVTPSQSMYESTRLMM